MSNAINQWAKAIYPSINKYATDAGLCARPGFASIDGMLALYEIYDKKWGINNDIIITKEMYISDNYAEIQKEVINTIKTIKDEIELREKAEYENWFKREYRK